MVRFRQTRFSAKSNSESPASFSPINRRKNYGSEQTGLRRHEYTAGPDINSVGSPAIFPVGEYIGFTLAAFRRTFTAVNDTEPTPTASNNYQTADVMNGSKIQNMNSKITLTNKSATVPAILDVYMLAMSYYDAFIWAQMRTANAPVTMSLTVGPPDNRGQVIPVTVTSTIISYNDWANFKFQQHYLKKVGTITVGNEDTDNVVEFMINDIPPQCRRSQTGMFYAVLFHADSTKNPNNLSLEASLDHKFEEIPTTNRLPFIE